MWPTPAYEPLAQPHCLPCLRQYLVERWPAQDSNSMWHHSHKTAHMQKVRFTYWYHITNIPPDSWYPLMPPSMLLPTVCLMVHSLLNVITVLNGVSFRGEGICPPWKALISVGNRVMYTTIAGFHLIFIQMKPGWILVVTCTNTTMYWESCFFLQVTHQEWWARYRQCNTAAGSTRCTNLLYSCAANIFIHDNMLTKCTTSVLVVPGACHDI